MKKSLKQKLALFLAIIMLFTMSLPVSMMAGAVDADGDGIEDVVPGEGEEVTPGEGEEVTPGEGEEGGEEGGEGEEPAPVDPNVIPALTDDVTTKVDLTTVVSSNTGFGGEGADNLFVAVKNTKFCGNVSFPFTVTWSMTEATEVAAYALTSGGDSASYPTRDPRGWTFYGSNDGEEWIELDTRDGQGFGQNGLTKVYAIAADKVAAYTQYKLEITDAAISMIQFSAIQLSTADLSADDADVAAAAAAAAFDAKLEALAAQETITQEEVTALRAEYNALDGATRNQVKKIKILTDAEALIVKNEVVVPLLTTLMAEIDTDMADGAVNGYSYYTNGKITTALALIKDVGEANAPANAVDILEAYRATLDEALNSAYTASVGNITNSPANNAPWMATMTEDEINATKAAVVAELVEQYTRQGFALNDALAAPGASINLTTTWGNIVLSQLEGGDNVTDPWGMGRRWSCLVAPFAGMAFSVKKYMGSTGDGQDLNILSNEFIYNGRVYQQRWSRLLSYQYGADADGTVPGLREETLYPGNGGSGDITANTFRYAYAKYNNDNKAAGLNVGIPVTNAVEADGVVYQEFASADGVAYIAASATAIATADAANPSENAYVINGDILTAILGEDDFATAIAKTGAPITGVNADGEQLFENGVATAEGFAEYTDENAHLKVEILLSKLPTEVTRDTLENVALAIEDAKAAVDALADPSVVDTTALTALEEAYNTLKADVDAAVEVEELIAAIATPITLESGEAITAASEAYEALTAEQQALVENIASLEEFVRTYDGLVLEQQIKDVEDMIDALPENEAIDGDEFEANAALVTAALEAYEALPGSAQVMVSNDRYDALMEKVDIVEAGGYTAWLEAQFTPGDIDGSKTVDVADIMMLKSLIMADQWTDIEEQVGDVDGSGSLDVGDIMQIKSMIMAG